MKQIIPVAVSTAGDTGDISSGKDEPLGDSVAPSVAHSTATKHTSTEIKQELIATTSTRQEPAANSGKRKEKRKTLEETELDAGNGKQDGKGAQQTILNVPQFSSGAEASVSDVTDVDDSWPAAATDR